MTARQAMVVGTAGFTSMLCVLALEKHGIAPADGTILVTGAAGGVGSVAISILSRLGYRVAAVTVRTIVQASALDESDRLQDHRAPRVDRTATARRSAGPSEGQEECDQRASQSHS